MNAKMPELKEALESAGFTDVKTVLSSGNVVFTAAKTLEALLQKKVEAVFEKQLGHTFLTIVRPVDLKLPIEVDGARILAMNDREVYTAYVPSPKGAVFMVLIEKTLGKEVTTRTWDTIAKVAR